MQDIFDTWTALDALRGSEERFRVLVDEAPEAIVLFAAEAGCFVEANGMAQQMFGMSRGQLLRRSPAKISPTRRPDGRSSKELAKAYVERALRGEIVQFE